MDSTRLYESGSEIYELLGRVYAQLAQRDAALSAFEQAIEVARYRQGVETLKAAKRAEMALVRIALERAAGQNEAWVTFILFLVLVAGVTVGYNLHRVGRGEIPQSTMLAPVAESDPPSRWDRRCRYLYEVLVDPRCALDFADDPAVREALEAGAVHSLKVLYLAAAALGHHDGDVLFGDPYNSYWRFFAEQFKARGLRRPARPEEWRAFFTASS